jgi:hypothetical protein
MTIFDHDVNLVLGLLNMLAAVLIWRRGQPKFAILAGAAWGGFAVTDGLHGTLFGLLGLATVVVSWLYFSRWQPN